MTPNRAITIRQPFADLIIAGVKDVENRSWEPPSTLPQWYRCDGCGGRYCPRGDGNPAPHPVHPGHHWLPSGITYGARTCGDWQPQGPYPFRLAIHAAQGWDHDASDKAADAHRRLRHDDSRWGDRRRASDLTVVGVTGAILGTVEVTGCHHADDCYPEGHRATDDCTCGFGEFGTHEPHCGYEPYCSPWAEPDRHHWTLVGPTPLDDPIPARGQQGLWRLDDDQAAALEAVAS